jgi:phage-related protein
MASVAEQHDPPFSPTREGIALDQRPFVDVWAGILTEDLCNLRSNFHYPARACYEPGFVLVERLDGVRKIANNKRENLPTTEVVFYREEDGAVPLVEWLDRLTAKAQDKCLARLKRLEDLGHELRRPEADYLRDGIYELRVSLQGVQYRMLYFFHGNVAAVVSHGILKEQVPPKEIDRAVERKKKFTANPQRHTFRSER